MAVARQYKLPKDAVYRHANSNHISDRFRAAVRVGPFRDETTLRRLCAETGTSVLENFRAIYAGLAARWLEAYKHGDDTKLVSLSGKMIDLLERQGKISGELMPEASRITNNFLITPEFFSLQASLLKALREFPEAKKALLLELRKLEGSNATTIDVEAQDGRTVST